MLVLSLVTTSARSATACATAGAARSTLSLWLLTLKARNTAAITNLIQTRLLLRLHCSDVKDCDRISLIQSRQHFRHIVVADTKLNDLRRVLAVLHDEDHSAASAGASGLPALKPTGGTSAILRGARLRSTLAITACLPLSEAAGARNLRIDARRRIKLLRLGLHCLTVELAVHHPGAQVAKLRLHVRMFRESRSHFLALVVGNRWKVSTSLPTLTATLSLRLSLKILRRT